MKHLKFFILSCLSLAMFFSPSARSQNSGPNAPEAMQFEPVDATDMVNLLTGDVSYVLPLLNIPNPEGGYPIALNYHAGITVDQEASWVGLGWNLNVGSINRSVMGIADDMNGSDTYITYYDFLGQDISNHVGVSLPIYGITVGLNVSWGSSWSVGGFVGSQNGLGVGLDVGSEGVGVSLGYQYGGMGASVRSGPEGWSLSANAGNGFSSASMSVNSDGSVGIGGNIGGIASMEVSFSSHGVGLSGNMLGFNSVASFSSMSSGNTYTLYSGWNADLMFVRFGHMLAKHFFFQKEIKNNYGVLYFSNSNLDSDEDYHYGGVQTLKNISDVIVYPYNNIDYTDNDQVEKSSQLMLPAYDNYSVNAQGLNGTMNPHFFKPGLIYGNGRTVATGAPDVDYTYDKGWYDKDKLVKDEIFYMNVLSDLPKISAITNNIYFYFNNVNESYLKIREGTFTSHSGDIIWGNTDFSGGQLESTSNYSSGKHRKVNSNFVEYFTNNEIINNRAEILNKGFLETESINDGSSNPRENQNLFDNSGIGAFAIVSADGKTYHYSLPVYQFESFLTKDLPDNSYYEQISTGKYAYTWLLTAVTGPDYIDRPDGSDNLGTVGSEDYGYWVKFEYGKWTDGYIWQLPYIKKAKEAYTWGRKQVYYLNSIKTRTHTAYFIKSLRNDGLGISKVLPATNTFEYKGNLTGYLGLEDCNGQTVTQAGIFLEDLILTRAINCNYNHLSLKLDKIVLVKNSDLALNTVNSSSLVAGAPLGDFYIHYNEKFRLYDMSARLIGEYCKPDLINSSFKIYYQNNVLDDKDNTGVNIEAKALKIIDLRYDYQLAKKTPNSLSTEDQGRLTLVSLIEKRTNGAPVTPPYVFNYNNYSNYNSDLIDEWGFNFINPDNWSLKEITTPVGTKIKLEYEGDTYLKETATNQTPYYVFNGYDLDATLIEYNSTTGAKFEVDVPCPYYVDRGTFFNDVTAYKGFIDFDAIYSKPGPPPEWRRVEERLRDVPMTIIISPYSVKFQFTYKNSAYNSWNFMGPLKMTVAIKVCKPGEMKRGGLRAKKITINDGTVDKQITEYGYVTPGTANTSGVTTYSPSHGIFIPYSYEQYTPAVFYEYVSIKSKTPDGSLDNEVLYKFEVPATTSDPNNLAYSTGSQLVVQNDQVRMSNDPFIPTYTVDGVYDITGHARSSVIKNNTATIGRPLNTKTMNSSGQVLNEIVYNYKPVSSTMPGSIQETFYYLKGFTQWGKDHHSSDGLFQYVSTSKVEYPSILDNMVSISNGLKTTTYYDSYDINTGEATSVRTVLPNGKEYKSVSIPAYTISSYSGGTSDNATSIGMGSKVWNIYNKNMLSQDVASYNLYNTGTSATPVWKTIGTGIQTWKSSWDNNGDEVAGAGAEDQTGVWRKHKTFSWKGSINTDGTFNSTYFNSGGRYTPENIAGYWSDFNGEGVNGWQKTSEVITYNKYSFPLQAKDINNNYNSSKTDKNDAYVFSSAGNARYNEFAYSGAEETGVAAGGYFGGNVKYVSGTISTTYAHTGTRSLSVASGYKGFSFVLTPQSRTYKVSVWVKGTTADYNKVQIGYNGSTEITGTNRQVFQAGDWFQVSGIVALGTGTSEFYCKANGATLYFDDFRIHPVDASLTGYVYDARDNVSAILNNDNFAVKFEYDEADRLINTYKETAKGFEKVANNAYNFSRCLCATGFSWTPTIATNNATLTFASYDNSNNCTYNWNFGDGTSNSTLRNPTHAFSVPGSNTVGYYTVTCTVTDSKGKTSSASNNVYFPLIKITNPNSAGTLYRSTSKIKFLGTLPTAYKIQVIPMGGTDAVYYYDFIGTQYGVNYEHAASNIPTGGPYEIKVSMPSYGVSSSVYQVTVAN